MTLLLDAGLTLELKNYSFFADVINYLDYFIRPEKLEGAESTTDAIRQV